MSETTDSAQGQSSNTSTGGLFSPANRLYVAWVIALVATLGSLYFSEVRAFKPCPLCWFQRIFMYPLAVMLTIAVWKNDLAVRRYILPLCLIGAGIALFQNLETWEIVPTIKACTMDPSASCGIPWPIWGISEFGQQLNKIITIPVLSFIAFVGIALLLWPVGQTRHINTSSRDTAAEQPLNPQNDNEVDA